MHFPYGSVVTVPCPRESWPSSKPKDWHHWRIADALPVWPSPGLNRGQSWLERRTLQRWRRWPPLRPLRRWGWGEDRGEHLTGSAKTLPPLRRYWEPFTQHDSHSDLRELSFGQVQRMVYRSDAVFSQVGTFGEVCTQDGVISHIHEGHHGVPALIVVPHLWKCWMVTQTGGY